MPSRGSGIKPTEYPDFNSILYSPSIMLPFQGSYGKIGVVFDMDRVGNLAKDADMIFASLQNQLDDLKQEMDELNTEVRKWQPVSNAIANSGKPFQNEA